MGSGRSEAGDCGLSTGSLAPASRRRNADPYLLRNLAITRANQVWAADITYLPMARGFLYLVVVMDWHSRYVVAWRLSNTLETGFCAEALNEALGWDRGVWTAGAVQDMIGLDSEVRGGLPESLRTGLRPATSFRLKRGRPNQTPAEVSTSL